jgi:hypothetical protein
VELEVTTFSSCFVSLGPNWDKVEAFDLDTGSTVTMECVLAGYEEGLLELLLLLEELEVETGAVDWTNEAVEIDDCIN